MTRGSSSSMFRCTPFTVKLMENDTAGAPIGVVVDEVAARDSPTTEICGGTLRFQEGSDHLIFMAGRSEDVARKPRADLIRNRERLLKAAARILGTGGARREPGGRRPARRRRHRHTLSPLPDARGAVRSGLPPRGRRARRACRANGAGIVPGRCPATMAARDRPARCHQEGHAGGAGARRRRAFGSLCLLGRSGSDKAVGTLLHRATKAGQIRADITPEDLLRALIGLCYSYDRPDWQEPVTRLLDVFVDGLVVKR